MFGAVASSLGDALARRASSSPWTSAKRSKRSPRAAAPGIVCIVCLHSRSSAPPRPATPSARPAVLRRAERNHNNPRCESEVKRVEGNDEMKNDFCARGYCSAHIGEGQEKNP